MAEEYILRNQEAIKGNKMKNKVLISLFCLALTACSSSNSDSQDEPLDQAVEPVNFSDQILGSFVFDTDNNCFESIVFSSDNSVEIIDEFETQTGSYSVGDLIVESGKYPLIINIDTDDQEPGCDGETDSSAGSTLSFFAQPNGEAIDISSSLDGDTLFTYNRYSLITDFSNQDFFGKQLMRADGNYIVVSADGTVSGTWYEGNVVGQWEFRDGQWCRMYSEFVFDPTFINMEQCHVWERSGDIIRGIRESGTGLSYFLTIQE